MADAKSRKRNKIVFYNQIVEYIRKKGRVPLGVVATKFGFSRHYFKYNILRTILELYDDIGVERRDGVEYLVVRG